MTTQQDTNNLYQDNDDLDFLGDYIDPRESIDIPADLAVLLDDDDREESLGAEDNIPAYQKPWVKVLSVLVLTGIGVAGAFAFFMGGQPKSSSQLAKTPQAGGDRTNFSANADDAAKTEIALGTQRRAFENSASPSPTPTSAVTTSPTPGPSVVVATPAPLPSVTVAPVSSPVVTAPLTQAAKPLTSTVQPKPKNIPVANAVQPKPTITPSNSALQPQPKTAPAARATKTTSVMPVTIDPQSIARMISQPASTKQSGKREPKPVNSPKPQPITKVSQQSGKREAKPAGSPKPQLIAKASLPAQQSGKVETKPAGSPKPQLIAKAPIPASQPQASVLNSQSKALTPISPEEQWLKMAEANRFGGRFADTVATNLPTTAASPAITPLQTTAPLSTQNRVINIGRNSDEAEEMLIPVSQGTPSPSPSNESGIQAVSFAQDSEPSAKDAPKPLITEFGVVNSSGKPSRYSIPPGTRFAGTLLTPVQAAGSSQTEQLLAIQLDQPIIDKDGQVAIAPRNTQIIFRWSLADGWIQATSESLVIDGQNVSITGAFTLQGHDGQPLAASTYQPGSDEVAAADRTTFLLGAARGVGEVLTTPDTSIVTNGLGGVTSSSTAKRDILGAVMRGGADPVLQNLNQRNQQRSQAIQSRKPIWYLQPGTRVNVYTTTPLIFTK